jgi:mannose-1-phosphate guanylyltransferase
MEYAMIMAGGSGTRLWPMSRVNKPKQLIPFINGKSLLQLAWERLNGLFPPENRFICANNQHADIICSTLNIPKKQFIGEPVGRDTVNAIGLTTAIISKIDPTATIAVFTADHIIEPIKPFQETVAMALNYAKQNPSALVTFGIVPTAPITGYGYIQLGKQINHKTFIVEHFKEKPNKDLAQSYFDAGPTKYLWNSGMFVWQAQTLLDCLKRYANTNYQGITQIANAWFSDAKDKILNQIFPTLPKTSVDYAIMEPASKDPNVQVATITLDVSWLDVGSWPAFAKTCTTDGQNNSVYSNLFESLNTKNCIVVSDSQDHLIATIGCENLIIIHTSDATLVCSKNDAESIKELTKVLAQKFGHKFI